MRAAARLLRGSAPLRVPAVPDRGRVAGVHRASALQTPLGAPERELHCIGRIVAGERGRIRFDGRIVIAQLGEAVALLEQRFGALLRAMVLALDRVVSRDRVGVPSGEVIAGRGEQRCCSCERRLRPAALELGSGGAGVVELALIEKRPGDPELRHVGAGTAWGGSDLVAPGLDSALHVADAHVEVAEPFARLERFRGGGVALYQLAVFGCGAARIVEVDGAEIAGELQRTAADGGDLLPLLVSQREQA